MKDLERDSRAALLTLQEICREAAEAGLETGPILREVAALSSERYLPRRGCTRDFLLKQCQTFKREL